MQINKQKNIEFKNSCTLSHQHSKTPARDLLWLPFGGFRFQTFSEGSGTAYDVFFTGRAGEGIFLLVHHPLPSHVSPCFQKHLPHLQNGSNVQTFRFVSFYVFLDYLLCFYFIHGFFIDVDVVEMKWLKYPCKHEARFFQVNLGNSM